MKKQYLAMAVAFLSFSLAACDSKSDTSKVDSAKPATQAAASSQKAETSNADAASVKTEDKQNISYLLGFQWGSSIVQAGVQDLVDENKVLDGLKDAFANKDSKLTQEQAQSAITTLNQVAQKIQIAKEKAYIEEGKKFLEDNAKRDGVVTTKSGLQYEVVQKGTGAKPKATDVVEVNYEGKLVNDKVFDSSRGKPVKIAVNAVIPGWVEALQLMQVGEKINLYIPSDLAYGANGVPPVIPPNSVLKFEIELVNIDKPSTQAPVSAKKAATPAKK